MGAATQPFISRLSAGFNQGALDQFKNPYIDSVLGARKRAIGEEFGRQSSALAAGQSATDAFRTGRSDLARSRLNASRMRSLDEATNSTNADAYQSALDAYFKQNQSDLGALSGVTGANASQVSALGATGANERGVAQANRDFDYGQFIERRDWDVNNLNTMLNALGAVNPAAGTNEKKKEKGSSDPFGQILGAVATVAGAYFTGGASLAVSSDRRLKSGIIRIATLDNGLGLYSYFLRDEKTRTVGVMSDEVRRIRPAAVSVDAGGFDRVNYGAIA